MIRVNSRISLNMHRIEELTAAQVTALEQTAEALHHTEIVQAQVIPRMDGTLQGEAFFIDRSESSSGKVTLVHNTPYARRLYFHPEYDFHKEPWEEEWTDRQGRKHHLTHDGNPNAKGRWFEDWEEGGKHADFAINTFKKIYRRLAGL